MTRNSALKVLNPILAILLLNQVLSAFLSSILPRGTFALLHKGGGLVFACAATLHVILNWNWIKATFFRKPSPPRRIE